MSFPSKRVENYFLTSVCHTFIHALIRTLNTLVKNHPAASSNYNKLSVKAVIIYLFSILKMHIYY